MNRRHYIILAKKIREHVVEVERWQKSDERSYCLSTLQAVVDDFCTVAKMDNARFDAERFRRACGL